MSQGKQDWIYCIDTSSLVNLRHWRPGKEQTEPWRRLEDLIKADRLMAPKAVLEELDVAGKPVREFVQQEAGPR